MADPLTIVGIVANVVQLVGFSADVIGRLKWCYDQGENAPRTIKEILLTLPALTETVEKVRENARQMAPSGETKQEFEDRYKSVLPLIKACKEDLDKLQGVIKEVVPDKGASKTAKFTMGMRGLMKDGKLERIYGRIKAHADVIKDYQDTTIQLYVMVLLQKIQEHSRGKEIVMAVDQLRQEAMKGASEIKAPIEAVTISMSQVAAAQGQNHTQILGMLQTIIAQTREVVPIQEIRKSVHNIPQVAVGDFVPRPGLSKRIAETFEACGMNKAKQVLRTVVLKGMGGQGKTQLTISYCQEALNSGTFHSVFWVDATSETSVLRSYEEIAEKLTTPAPKFGSDKDRKEFVETRLKAWDSPFLLVFDNYDDPQEFKGREGIRKYMPDCEAGYFLVTSRHSASTRLCQTGSVIDVEGMTEEEAAELFVLKSEVDVEAMAEDASAAHHHKHGTQLTAEERQKVVDEALDEVAKIVKRLGNHALAIDFIGTYFRGRNLPLNKILDDYNNRADEIHARKPDSWHEYRKRLNGKAEEDTVLNVFTSISLSYEQLGREESKENMEVYERMLALLAFLHSELLSEKIFQAQQRALGPTRTTWPKWLQFFVGRTGWNQEKFIDMLVQLKDKLLISGYTRTGVAGGITFHPLVKDWLKLRLKEEERSECAVSATLMVERLLNLHRNEVATFDMKQEEKREALSYVAACHENVQQFCCIGRDDDSITLGRGDLAPAGQTFALFLEFMGKIDEAQKIFEILIEWRTKRASDPKDPELLTTKSLYTEILRLQKNFKDAKKLDQEVYLARKETLGDEHPDTLWSAHDLGWDLEALGDVDEAEKLQRIAYEGRRRVLSPSHALTLQSVNNLAHTLRRQGKTLEALDRMKETLRIGREVFQLPHTSELLQFMSNLQDVLRFQGKLDEAELMARDSYEATKNEWGEDHLKAAASRGQLKDILWDRNKAEEAEKVAMDNLAIMEKSPYSTDISRIDDIALLLDTLSGRQMTDGGSRKNDILKYANQALKLVRKLQDNTPEILDLPSTIQDLIYLSTGLEVLRASEQLVELEPIILDHCKTVFGVSDRNSVNSLVRLSSALRVQGRAKEADKYCQDAIDELKEKLEQGDSQDPKSTRLAALSWLAVLYKHINKRRNAMDVYDRAFVFVTEGDFIEKADYETLYSIQGLAEDIDDQRRCQKAEILHKAVLDTRRKRYKEHPCVDDSLYAYSWNLRLQDRLTEAEDVCKEALVIAEKFRGPHRNTMCILKRLAYLEEQLGNHEAAEGHYREVLAGFRALGTRHMTRVTEALEDLQELLMEQRKWVEARDLIQDAIDRRSNGWDQNPGHHAGLIRHLAIVTWELGDGVEGLRLYRRARKTYEEAWKLHTMPEGPQKQNLIRRINELLPGTENMEEEMRIEREENEAAQAANEASMKQNADVEAADDGQETPTQAVTSKPAMVRDVKAGLDRVSQQLANHIVASHAVHDGKSNQYQTSTKSNEEATACDYDAPGVSLSRQSTLGANSLPEAPDNEPSKLDDQDPRRFEEITRQLGQMNMNAA